MFIINYLLKYLIKYLNYKTKIKIIKLNYKILKIKYLIKDYNKQLNKLLIINMSLIKNINIILFFLNM